MRGAHSGAVADELELTPIGVIDLEVIDLSDPMRPTSRPGPLADFRSFEERYATLAFGLGTVPRRQRPDDPLWQRPAGLLLAVSGLLTFLLFLSAAH